MRRYRIQYDLIVVLSSQTITIVFSVVKKIKIIIKNTKSKRIKMLIILYRQLSRSFAAIYYTINGVKVETRMNNKCTCYNYIRIQFNTVFVYYILLYYNIMYLCKREYA